MAGEIDLQDGAAGVALLHAARGERDAALELLERAEEALGESPLPLGLFTGVTGVAWCGEVVRALLREEEPERNEPVDELLIASLDRRDCPFHYELATGLVGFGLYALARGEPGRPIAELAVRHLAGFAREDEGGVGFFTPPEHLPPHQRELAPAGFYNLGVAHGGAGAIGFLAGCVAAGISSARALLDPAVSWLLARRSPDGFPLAHGVASPTTDGWCHGAPGIALTIDAAGRAAGVEAWCAEALSIARDAAARARETSAAGGLCHGAAGLGGIFARLGAREPSLAAAGDRLLARAAAAPPGEPGFLAGAAGTSLALERHGGDWFRFFLAGGPL